MPEEKDKWTTSMMNESLRSRLGNFAIWGKKWSKKTLEKKLYIRVDGTCENKRTMLVKNECISS